MSERVGMHGLSPQAQRRNLPWNRNVFGGRDAMSRVGEIFQHIPPCGWKETNRKECKQMSMDMEVGLKDGSLCASRIR